MVRELTRSKTMGSLALSLPLWMGEAGSSRNSAVSNENDSRSPVGEKAIRFK